MDGGELRFQSVIQAEGSAREPSGGQRAPDRDAVRPRPQGRRNLIPHQALRLAQNVFLSVAVRQLLRFKTWIASDTVLES